MGEQIEERINLGSRPGITPTPIQLIGTWNDDNTPNAMLVSWCASSTRKITEINIYAIRKTAENIKKRKAFTLSCVTSATLAQCDYLGTVSGHKVPDKVRHTGLYPLQSTLVNAPFFKELPIVIECELLRIEPQENGTILKILANTRNVAIDKNYLKADGNNPDFEKLRPVCWDQFSSHYFSLGEDLGDMFTLGKKFDIVPFFRTLSD